MKIFQQPLTRILGIGYSSNYKYLLCMKANPDLLMHLGVIHASALYSFAEITNGLQLNIAFPQFAENTTPLVRTAQIKYHKVANGDLYSTAQVMHRSHEAIAAELTDHGRVQLTISVKVFNTEEKLVSSATFDWFVTLNK
jgi:acyl-coenzyme A thioesterase PaaI-like protein